MCKKLFQIMNGLQLGNILTTWNFMGLWYEVYQSSQDSILDHEIGQHWYVLVELMVS